MAAVSGSKVGPRDPEQVARALQVVERGARARWWRREARAGRSFRYVTADGLRVTSPAELARIKALAIPPAWTHVRIAPSARSRLQAIGIDRSGRPQYVYHARFAARRRDARYGRVLEFGERLGALRSRADADIQRPGMPRERVLAIITRLIGELLFRVGSEAHAHRYRTYGVTTLRNRHVTVGRGGTVRFDFRGKGRLRHRRVLADAELAAALRRLKAIGGSRLFNYLDDEGRARPVTARDVNAYIKSALGTAFSAKDFRTWGGTLTCAVALAEMGPAEDERTLKRRVNAALRRVAEALGNTPAVCRQSYVHPGVLESYARGQTLAEHTPRARRRVRFRQENCEPEEVALLRLLRGDQAPEPAVRAPSG